MQLYDNATSTNALKVRFLLGELGLACERVEVPLDERPDWYRALHPWATVPCLVDDGLVLTESNAILRYLAAREGRVDLYPEDVRTRARVETVLDAVSLQVRPALWDLERVALYGEPPGEDPLPALVVALDGWERTIDGDGYCVGRSLTIADCAAAGRLVHLPGLVPDLGRWPRTAAMLETVTARPAFRAALG